MTNQDLLKWKQKSYGKREHRLFCEPHAFFSRKQLSLNLSKFRHWKWPTKNWLRKWTPLKANMRNSREKSRNCWDQVTGHEGVLQTVHPGLCDKYYNHNQQNFDTRWHPILRKIDSLQCDCPQWYLNLQCNRALLFHIHGSFNSTQDTYFCGMFVPYVSFVLKTKGNVFSFVLFSGLFLSRNHCCLNCQCHPWWPNSLGQGACWCWGQLQPSSGNVHSSCGWLLSVRTMMNVEV